MVVGHAHIAHKSPLFVLSFSLPSPKRIAHNAHIAHTSRDHATGSSVNRR